MFTSARLLAAALLLSACGAATSSSSSSSSSSAPVPARVASDPVADGAPCGEASQRAGFTLTPGGLAEPLVSVSGVMEQGDAALCPGDGLVPNDGFELYVQAGADEVHIHVIGVASDDEILALTPTEGVRLAPGERLRVPEDDQSVITITGTEGVEYVVFIASVGPLAAHDPELAQWVALAAEGSGDAERLRLPPRGEVVIDPPGHRVDARAEGGVAVIPFPIHHRATGRTRGIGMDI